ncbi:MAG: periplasmic heavy metal sensor [Bacteroidales bacterium]|nr:periplasmic heavy metal sensor [Bacteroidales bacterium]
MKTQKIKKVSVIIIAVLMIAGSNLYAQQGRNNARQGQNVDQKQSCQMIPDLTEDQESKIESLRLEKMKEMTAFRNQVNELKAKKQTLMTSDNSDSKEINTVIDQMTDIHNKMMKASAKHHQDVRNLLTDDQKVIFDSKPMRGHGHGKGHGMRNGSGNGRGAGQARCN